MIPDRQAVFCDVIAEYQKDDQLGTIRENVKKTKKGSKAAQKDKEAEERSNPSKTEEKETKRPSSIGRRSCFFYFFAPR